MASDPLFRAQVENDIRLLQDPEVEVFVRRKSTGFFQAGLMRRRGADKDPDFRFRDPDRA